MKRDSHQQSEVDFRLIKTKKRVEQFGEVYTPCWVVEAMLDLFNESDQLGATFLEPACGNGNFLVSILERKFDLVNIHLSRSQKKRDILILQAVMSVYGVDILEDNIVECHERLLKLAEEKLKVDRTTRLYWAIKYVFTQNIIVGDTIKMVDQDGSPIIFPKWSYAGRELFEREDFVLGEMFSSKSNQSVPQARETVRYNPVDVVGLSNL